MNSDFSLLKIYNENQIRKVGFGWKAMKIRPQEAIKASGKFISGGNFSNTSSRRSNLWRVAAFFAKGNPLEAFDAFLPTFFFLFWFFLLSFVERRQFYFIFVRFGDKKSVRRSISLHRKSLINYYQRATVTVAANLLRKRISREFPGFFFFFDGRIKGKTNPWRGKKKKN